jgi:type I restriction enzyme S subunit
LVIRPYSQNLIDGEFLSRLIRTREQQILQSVTGSTVFHLYASSIENLDIVFPSIEEQTAVGNYFQKLDSLIDQHSQQITKLNNIKQACLSKMFV